MSAPASATTATTTTSTEAPSEARLTDALTGLTMDVRRWERLLAGERLQPEVARATKAASETTFKFWSEQPMPSLTAPEPATVDESGPIDAPKTVADVQPTPYSLGDDGAFEWSDVDLTDAAQLTELYALLEKHYVEDDDETFRFNYSREFLAWALQPPGYRLDWHVGVRIAKSQRLVAFISAVPATVRVYNDALRVVEINFLCVHKKLRSKRMAPVLIKEITRRVNAQDIWQAVYTAGALLPKPIGSALYWHRSLNPKKLIEIGFSSLKRDMSMAKTIKFFMLPAEPTLRGLRAMTRADVGAVRALVNTYMQKFGLAPHYESDDELAHWLMPRAGVVWSYVVVDGTTADGGDVVTDFISFYTLPSTIVKHTTQHTLLTAAYSYYIVPNAHDRVTLMRNALILANASGHDVFNALDEQDNDRDLLKRLKFGMGDGRLNFYIYNWRAKPMPGLAIGLTML